MRPGWSEARVPNCSAMTRGEWFGSMTPPAPSRMVDVWAATWAMSTAGADDAIVFELWCSAYQTLAYPRRSAARATSTQPRRLSPMLSFSPIEARSSTEYLVVPSMTTFCPSGPCRGSLWQQSARGHGETMVPGPRSA